MKHVSRFTVSASWKLMLIDMQIEPSSVLALARLPADLFNRDNASLSPAEYFRLWQGIELAAGERELPLLLAESLSAEAFDAPIFAALCSDDLNTAVSRLSRYKPLIGPMTLTIEQDDANTTLTLDCYGNAAPIPASLGMSEAVFFTQLARLGTRQPLQPVSVCLPVLPDNLTAYTGYFGCQPTLGAQVSIAFSAADASRPFLTANRSMWSFFEDKLNRQLADLDSNASTVARVRAVLMEALPGGEAGIETVASALAISKRTLQRKLTAEDSSFQAVLGEVRAELADHYLEQTRMSLGEIAFMLGFQEANSFIRAYSAWKGISPGHYRDQLH
ncbi:AraC family transcriptional regulator [Marinobacterium jannaschii]|uniref:AraC family transcriptional regulator n=1 Tax=Marinobacterium jannaschii TaxID=64970 RepID=UPI00048112E9|nr:AraC family transcriptional regulator [Marinobacterium jannaschii]